jgi:hypothetical protein
MNDSQYIVSQWLSPDTVSDLNYKIVAVIDMNADGKPDLVWHHATTTELAVWYMNGVTMTSTAPFDPQYVGDANWKVVGAR